MNPFAQVWKWAAISGILSTVLGALVLMWPTAGIVVAAALLGGYLLVSGIAQLIGAFGLPAESGGGRVLMFISGAASLILSVLCFRDVSESVVLLATWIGIGFVFRGVTAVATAFGETAVPGRAWIALFGVVTVLAGFVMLASPFSSLRVLALVAGVWLIASGVAETLSGIQVHRAAKRLADITTRAVPA